MFKQNVLKITIYILQVNIKLHLTINLTVILFSQNR